MKVVWGLGAADKALRPCGRAALWSFRLGAILSRFPDLIIVNSQAGMRHHMAEGYAGARMRVIPNGIDTDRCRPDRDAGRRLRAELGIREGQAFVGLVARLDPVKDHATFLEAAALALRERPDLHFICVGSGPPRYQKELVALVEALGLGGRVTWRSESPDVPAVYNALEVATLCSTSEGFPNVVAEAMAWEVPCVVTDVGDAAERVGDTGRVVPPRDPAALAAAWLRLLALPASDRQELGTRARARIVREFNLDLMIERTAAALAELVVVA